MRAHSVIMESNYAKIIRNKITIQEWENVRLDLIMIEKWRIGITPIIESMLD